MKLNGWQRIGVIVFALWAVVAFAGSWAIFHQEAQQPAPGIFDHLRDVQPPAPRRGIFDHLQDAPPIQVELAGGGIAEFPAGTSREVMEKALRQRFGTEQSAQPQTRGPSDNSPGGAPANLPPPPPGYRLVPVEGNPFTAQPQPQRPAQLVPVEGNPFAEQERPAPATNNFWRYVPFVIIIPALIVWGLISLIIVSVRWVRRGFRV